MSNCKQCSQAFEVTDEDLEFYQKIRVPEPAECPDCRWQKRLNFRNVMHLYRRKCDLTGQSIVSMFHPDKFFPVYDQTEWYGDKWDALTYGREFDFSRPFFEQYAELSKLVPRWSKIVIKSENSDYCLNCTGMKNCYLCSSCAECEDCLYSRRTVRCRDCVDCTNVQTSEQCYECLDSEGLTHVQWGIGSKNCQESAFLFNCRNCEHCFGCVNLTNQSYYFFNEKFEPADYEKRVEEYWNNIEKTKDEFHKFVLKFPQRASEIFNCENCTGNYLYNSKNIFDSFFVFNSEDSRFITDSDKVKLCYDCNDADEFTECYGVSTSITCNRTFFCENIETGYNTFYSSYCVHVKDCFGCIGLKHRQYCILNRQFLKEDYEKFVPKIIEHMRQTGEWGSFFPIKYSPFGYNESQAQLHFPFEKNDAKKRGWQWCDYESPLPDVTKKIPGRRLPDRIADIPDDVLNWAIECEVTGKPFKITPQELKFYRNHNIPVPKKSSLQRYLEREQWRNPRKLWKRQCDKCGFEIQTTYSPDRPEKVYCERCYLKEVY